MKTLSQILRLLALTTLMAMAQAQIVSIPDLGLNAAIRTALQKPGGPLTVQDMLTLSNLNAGKRGVRSLEGLGAAHNLSGLDLQFSQLRTLTNTLGAVFFIDEGATNSAQRFYRAITTPP